MNHIFASHISSVIHYQHIVFVDNFFEVLSFIITDFNYTIQSIINPITHDV